MIRVISSPSSSTTGLLTLIFAMSRRSSSADHWKQYERTATRRILLPRGLLDGPCVENCAVVNPWGIDTEIVRLDPLGGAMRARSIAFATAALIVAALVG